MNENTKNTLFAILLIFCLVSVPLHAAPKSIFVQVSSIFTGTEAWKTRTWFEKLCADHKTSGSDNYIYNIVLQQTADSEGNLFDKQLDIIDDYFNCFDNIFMGTAITAWDSSVGNKYIFGMTNESYRWDNIRLARVVADKLLDRYAGLWFHWYITHEANLSYFIGDEPVPGGFTGKYIKDVTQAFLRQHSDDLYAKANRAIMWSPAFWANYQSMKNSGLMPVVQNAIREVLISADKITWLHFQDSVGKGSRVECANATQCAPWQRIYYRINCTDALGYYNMIKAIQPSTNITSLRVNMEMFLRLFSPENNKLFGYLPGDIHEMKLRETCYTENNIPIGASWEIRWWYLATYGVPSISYSYPASVLQQ